MNNQPPNKGVITPENNQPTINNTSNEQGAYYKNYVENNYKSLAGTKISQVGPSQQTPYKDDNYGYLQVKTYAGRGAYPVAGAKVTIYTYKDSNDATMQSNRQLLYFLETDAQGETPPVILEAPSLANSKSPNLPAYYVYYVQINHPEYYTVADIPVQIFPNQASVLPVGLVPLRSDI